MSSVVPDQFRIRPRLPTASVPIFDFAILMGCLSVNLTFTKKRVRFPRIVCLPIRKIMNSVVEKLAAIEKEVAAIQPKMAPLTDRIADLDQKIAGFAQLLTGIAEESAAVKQDIELTRQSLARIQMLIGESKVESEQLAAGQEESIQRCETMTAVFGAAFQAMSQFFETAQRMGLADQAKAVFQVPPIVSLEAKTLEAKTPVPEPAVEKKPLEEPSITESDLIESDFDMATSNAEDAGGITGAVPELPDVATIPEMVDTDADSDIEPSSEMASQLELPPLNLSTHAPPEPSPVTENADDEDIEAMLAALSAPINAAAVQE